MITSVNECYLSVSKSQVSKMPTLRRSSNIWRLFYPGEEVGTLLRLCYSLFQFCLSNFVKFLFLFFFLQEVFRLMKEGRTDIMSDPVLYSACSLEVKRYCSHIPFGRGKGTLSKWSRVVWCPWIVLVFLTLYLSRRVLQALRFNLCLWHVSCQVLYRLQIRFSCWKANRGSRGIEFGAPKSFKKFR